MFDGTVPDRELKRLIPLVERINRLEPEAAALSDVALRARTGEFRQRLENGEPLDDLIPETFATVREAMKRAIDKKLGAGAAPQPPKPPKALKPFSYRGMRVGVLGGQFTVEGRTFATKAAVKAFIDELKSKPKPPTEPKRAPYLRGRPQRPGVGGARSNSTALLRRRESNW